MKTRIHSNPGFKKLIRDKKIIYSAFILMFIMIGLESFHSSRLMKKDGAAPGYTGSPGDSLKNCTACHGGDAKEAEGWITSNIPDEGYIPNQTYTIRVVNKESGLFTKATRFGFEVSPQNISGDLLGKIVITDTVKTKLVGLEKYITYTENGIESIDSMTWYFDWVAPAKGTGEVVFYGAFNSNYQGGKETDHTYLSDLKVKEKTSSVQSLSKTVSNIEIYPNPAKDIVTINITGLNHGVSSLQVFNIAGQTVLNKTLEIDATNYSEKLNVLSLPSGQYFVVIEQENKRAVGRFIKQ